MLGTDADQTSPALPAVSYPEGAFDASARASDLRLSQSAEQVNAVLAGVRALETTPGACVVIHGGSGHERLLTRIGEVMLPAHIWEWYLRGRPSSPVAIVAELGSLRAYVETRSRRAIAQLADERRMFRDEHSRSFADERIAGLERGLADLARFAGAAG